MKLVGFIAFKPDDAKRVDEANEIDKEWFATCEYIPVRADPELAIESAMKGLSVRAAKSALEPTDWIVLEIELTEEQVGTLFVEDKITRAPDYRGWRFYENIALQTVSRKEWIDVKIWPQGIEGWAAKFMPQKRLTFGGKCAECGKQGQTMWKSSRGSYCASCWHYHTLNKPDGKRSIFSDADDDDGESERAQKKRLKLLITP